MTFKEWANQAHVGDVCEVHGRRIKCVKDRPGRALCARCVLKPLGCDGVHCCPPNRHDGVSVVFLEGSDRRFLDEPVVSLVESGEPTLRFWANHASVGDQCKVGNAVLECAEASAATSCDDCALLNCECFDVCCEAYEREDCTSVYFVLRKGAGTGLDPHMTVTPLPRQEEGEQ